jgi:hypothetical protein
MQVRTTPLINLVLRKHWELMNERKKPKLAELIASMREDPQKRDQIREKIVNLYQSTND